MGRHPIEYDIYHNVIIKGRLRYAWERLRKQVPRGEGDILKTIAKLNGERYSDSLIDKQIYVARDPYGMETRLNPCVVHEIAQVSDEARRRFEESFSDDPLAQRLVELNFLNIDFVRLYQFSDEDFIDLSAVNEDRELIKEKNLTTPKKLVGVEREDVVKRKKRLMDLYLYHTEISAARHLFVEAPETEVSKNHGGEFPPDLCEDGVKSLSLMMHVGNHFVNPNPGLYKDLLTDLLKTVPVRVLINSEETAKALVLPHVDGPDSMYPDVEKTRKAWIRMADQFKEKLEVRECNVPFFHRCYLAEYEGEVKVSCRFYTLGNDINSRNPVLQFSSLTNPDTCELYQKEFDYLWHISTPIA